MNDEKQKYIDAFFEWRARQNRKHRVMTAGEHAAWLAGGDIISHPSNSGAMAGGLTILLNTPPVIGRIEGYEPPPEPP